MINFNKTSHKMCSLYRGGLLIFAKLLYHFHKIVCSNDIPYSANIDGVYFCHNGLGIVINPNSVIGRGTVIQHFVTIGEIDGSHKCPKIGSNVYIGAHAIILGDITIGDNAKIGAGAVVIHDVPANCTAVGVPAKILNSSNL
jgi:serine O-acetyltransferase